jgi:hypothetical protein
MIIQFDRVDIFMEFIIDRLVKEYRSDRTVQTLIASAQNGLWAVPTLRF